MSELGKQHFPYESDWWKGTAAAAKLTGATETRRAALETLVQIESDDPAPRKALAELALSEGNFDAAYKFGKLAIHIDVLDADVHRILGDALKGKKEFERAIVEYETALELKPNDSAVQTSLAETYADAGQAEKAGRLLDEILKKAPDSERTKELKQRIK